MSCFKTVAVPQPIYKYILSYLIKKVKEMPKKFQKKFYYIKCNIFCENEQFSHFEKRAARAKEKECIFL